MIMEVGDIIRFHDVWLKRIIYLHMSPPDTNMIQ